MRRPLKPFVTEYKGSNRRGIPGLDTAESDRPKAFEPVPKFEADDTYEAAMRAADALFSGVKKPETAGAVADSAASAASPGQQEGRNVAAGPTPTGRILRVIDEPPAPELLALEAERAPKRRGRKPGSKNKPKPPVDKPPVDLQAAAENGAATAKRRRGRPPKVAVAAQTLPAIATLAALPNAALPNAAPAEAAPAKANGLIARDDKRFPWIRDRLKPGEAWKRRRLPRVCW